MYHTDREMMDMSSIAYHPETCNKINNNYSIVKEWDTNDINGFYACIIDNGDGGATISFRGSEGMTDIGSWINDWGNADLKLLNHYETIQQAELKRFLEDPEVQGILRQYDYIDLTGHSLGANHAEFASIIWSTIPGLENTNPRRCVSNDGPGYSQEFFDKYKNEINNNKFEVVQYKWSIVGGQLKDIPADVTKWIEVEPAEGNALSRLLYTLTRHDMKNVKFDENGMVIEGKRDEASIIGQYFSRGMDHLPSFVGDAIVELLIIGGIPIVTLVDECLDDKGNLNANGYMLIGYIASIALMSPELVMSLAVAGLEFLAVTIVLVSAVVLYEIAYEFVEKLVDDIIATVSETIGAIKQWTKELIESFKQTVSDTIKGALNWIKNKLNPGNSYSETNPHIVVDTYSLREYASRLDSVNKRIASLDYRLDALYGKVGLLDLWNLIQADLLTSYSVRLTGCSGYLKDTADIFESTENKIISKLS